MSKEAAAPSVRKLELAALCEKDMKGKKIREQKC